MVKFENWVKGKIMIKHTFVICAYKESEYLEECIKSIKNQSIKSKVIITTSTDNLFIRELAEKYYTFCDKSLKYYCVCYEIMI